MKQKYTTHSIKTKDGKFVVCRNEVEVILELIYSGKEFIVFDGKTITVFSDKIETVGKDVKRVTVVEVV